ncbi:MAG TPA: hypothetical protein VI758_01590 [Bacteroidota bacterium]
MKDFLSLLWKLALITVIGLAGSMTLGLMMHGSNMFDPKGAEFAYVAFGTSGAFIFAFYHVRGLSNTITAAVTVSAVQFIVASAWMPTVNSVVWSFGVNLPVVWLAFLFERKLAAFHWGKFVIVGIVNGTMFVLLTLLVGIIQNVSSMPAAVFRDNFVDGLLIGLGMGIGVQGGEAFIHSIGTSSWTTHREF